MVKTRHAQEIDDESEEEFASLETRHSTKSKQNATKVCIS